jgi:hypothetical protein
MPRTPDERLRVFDRHVLDLLTESVARSSFSVSWKPDGVTTDEPGREALRSWLIAVRGLDAPKDDTYLPTIMGDLDALAGADVTRQRVGVLRERYRRAAVRTPATVTGPDGPMDGRACFEMLAYTDHLHRDADREAMRAALPPFIWEMVRFIGYDYAGELGEIATWLQAAGREDPATAHLFEPFPSDGAD